MIKKFVVLILAFLMTGCFRPPVSYKAYHTPVSYKDRHIHSDHKDTDNIVNTQSVLDGWYKNEVLYDEYVNYGYNKKHYKYRKGYTPDGDEYRIYNDGSAGLINPTGEHWSIGCKKDAITDEKSCNLYKDKLFIFYINNNIEICILGHNFPGRRGAIRIGSNKAITTDYNGCIDGNKHITQLYSEKRMTVRYYKWPYDYPKDDNFDINGLQSAMELMKFIYKNGDTLKF